VEKIKDLLFAINKFVQIFLYQDNNVYLINVKVEFVILKKCVLLEEQENFAQSILIVKQVIFVDLKNKNAIQFNLLAV